MSASAAPRRPPPAALGELPAIGPDAFLWVVLSPDVTLRTAAGQAASERPIGPQRKRA